MVDAVAGRPLAVLELGAGFGGTAAATADLGHRVVAIERSGERAAFARWHVWTRRSGQLEVIEADFNSVALSRQFDMVTYWSGFGIGDDAAQARLLVRIARWLKPGGRVFIDVFEPLWWANANGVQRETNGLAQRLDFDPCTSRCSITCWPQNRPTLAVTETIRCYRTAEFLAMANNAGLALSPGVTTESVATPSYLVQLTSPL